MNNLVSGGLLALTAVALGAFGAHGLRPRLSPRDMEIFETAVRYQMIHALAIILMGIFQRMEAFSNIRLLDWAPWAFGVGTLLFSGSLYIMVLTGKRWLGAVTPLGGVLFLAGWFMFVLAMWKR